MSEVSWRAWGEAAFAEAQAQNKPVLLSITAVWCQWCRQMEDETYANEAIAQYINENFVPIQVDSDLRPEVNSRYTTGGWPTTCVLTPEGDTIWASNYVQPQAMAETLPQVLNAFHNDKQGLANHVEQQRAQLRQQTSPPALDPTIAIPANLAEIIVNGIGGVRHNFDFAFGGFGREQKFPHIDVLELLLEQYARSVAAGAPDADLRLMLDRTLTAMASGGLHDSVDGGFFRYTQTPDWREPHYEKLLEDNALIARLYARAGQALNDPRWTEVARKTLGYLDTPLYIPERGVWSGSQAADSEYYAQPPEERSEWNPPAADETVLCGPNALAARAHIAWWAATGETDALARARRAVDYLLDNLQNEDGSLRHYEPADPEDDEETIPSGLLGDAADVAAACLDLYEAGQGYRYLNEAEKIVTWVRDHLEDPRAAGIFDCVTRPDAIGNMKYGSKDLIDNMQMADAVLRLGIANGDEEYARFAQRTLQAIVATVGNPGFIGAGMALVVERNVVPAALVHVLGAPSDPRTEALVAAAHRPYRFERMVLPLDPTDADDTAYIEDLGYPAPAAPVAYVRVGDTVTGAISDPAVLRQHIAAD